MTFWVKLDNLMKYFNKQIITWYYNKYKHKIYYQKIVDELDKQVNEIHKEKI